MARTLKSRITVAVVLLLIAAAQSRSQENPVGGVWADPATGLMWAAKDSGKDVNFKGAYNSEGDSHLNPQRSPFLQKRYRSREKMPEKR